MGTGYQEDELVRLGNLGQIHFSLFPILGLSGTFSEPHVFENRCSLERTSLFF